MRLAIAALFACLAVSPAFAQEDEHVFTFGPIAIEHPWARAAAAGADTLAFVEILNDGLADRVVGLSTDVATSVELVGLTIRNGLIEMVPVPDFDLPPGEFTFDPNGLGIALRGLTRPLVEGTEFELTMTLRNAGAMTFHVLVQAPDAVAHEHAH